MFDIIKSVCRLNSQEMVSKYLLSRGQDPVGRDLQKTRLIISMMKEIESLCEEYDIQASFGTVSSRLKNANEEWFDVSVYMQAFAHSAPVLGELVNDLAKAFDVEKQDDCIRVLDPKHGQPRTDFLAEYFVSGDDFFAVNLANGEILNIEGKHIGGSLKESDGKSLISWNIEIEPAMDSFIHEVVQVKLAEPIEESGAFAGSFPEINDRVRKRLKSSERDPFHAMEELKEERSRIYNKFKDFDNHLHRLLGDI